MQSNELAIEQRLTAREVAQDYFRTSEAVVFEWVRRGVFPPRVAFRIGRKILFNKFALERWVAEGGTLQKTV